MRLDLQRRVLLGEVPRLVVTVDGVFYVKEI